LQSLPIPSGICAALHWFHLRWIAVRSRARRRSSWLQMPLCPASLLRWRADPQSGRQRCARSWTTATARCLSRVSVRRSRVSIDPTSGLSIDVLTVDDRGERVNRLLDELPVETRGTDLPETLGCDSKVAFRLASAFRRRFAQVGLHQSRRFQPLQRRIHTTKRYGSLPLHLDLAGDWNAVGFRLAYSLGLSLSFQPGVQSSHDR
jgi:hypothetical protein